MRKKIKLNVRVLFVDLFVLASQKAADNDVQFKSSGSLSNTAEIRKKVPRRVTKNT